VQLGQPHHERPRIVDRASFRDDIGLSRSRRDADRYPSFSGGRVTAVDPLFRWATDRISDVPVRDVQVGKRADGSNLLSLLRVESPIDELEGGVIDCCPIV